MTSSTQDKQGADESVKTRMSVDQAIQLAIGLQQRFELDPAEAIYREILETAPDNPDALHFYGVLHHQRGNTREACRLIARALSLAPDYLDAYNNLGNIHREADQLAEAEACYRKVIALDSRNAGAHNNLGSVLRAQGRIDQAREAYEKALALAPEFAAPHMNMGHLLTQQGRLAEAVSYYARSILLDPELSASKRHMGIALSCLGRLDEAADVFRQWMESEPDNAEARHLYAACSGNHVPQRAPDTYIRQVFDSFAGTFEERLAGLAYRAPQLVADAAAKVCGPPAGNLQVLDAGCGTGLCGPLLRPFARKLIGVDLSPGMLKRAAAAGVYDALREAELTAYMYAHPDAFDLIVSADTLCYFGELEPVLYAAARALRTSGYMIFSIEDDRQPDSKKPADYRIQPHGRYCHREGYVRIAAETAELIITSLFCDTLRQEMGRPVAGMVVTAQKS